MENELQGIIGDSFLNISAVKTFSMKDYECNRARTHADEMLRKLKDFRISSAHNITSKNSFLNFLVTSALIITTVVMFLEKSIEIDMFVFLLRLIGNITYEIQYFGVHANESIEDLQKIKSGITLLSCKEKISDRENAVDIGKDGIINMERDNTKKTNKDRTEENNINDTNNINNTGNTNNTKGRIVFRNVCFSYPMTEGVSDVG
jgi:ABC-type multidrug transport system fused ATPase/permease subunit